MKVNALYLLDCRTRVSNWQCCPNASECVTPALASSLSSTTTHSEGYPDLQELPRGNAMFRWTMWCVGLVLVQAVNGPVATAGDQPVAVNPIRVEPGDWAWWRGPTRNGVAPSGQTVPTRWSATEGVRWKAPVPGKGHGSPIVVGKQVILNTAVSEPDEQWVYSFHRETGELVWKTRVHEGGFVTKQNEKSTSANSTPACDGERIFVNFLSHGAIYTTALNLNGKQLWQEKINDYTLHQGFSSSPALYGSLVIVSADNKGGTGVTAGLDRATGKVAWSHARPALPNYPSPILLNIGGKDQVFLMGAIWSPASIPRRAV